MGKKKVFYLDPAERKWTMKNLGFSSQVLDELRVGMKEIEGIFLMKNGKIRELFELPNHCIVCLDPLAYNDEFDSVFCPACDEWRETSCGDPECECCLERPEKPSLCK